MHAVYIVILGWPIKIGPQNEFNIWLFLTVGRRKILNDIPHTIKKFWCQYSIPPDFFVICWNGEFSLTWLFLRDGRGGNFDDALVWQQSKSF